MKQASLAAAWREGAFRGPVINLTFHVFWTSCLFLGRPIVCRQTKTIGLVLANPLLLRHETHGEFYVLPAGPQALAPGTLDSSEFKPYPLFSPHPSGFSGCAPNMRTDCILLVEHS